MIVIKIAEIYSQCARAIMRAGLWSRNDADSLPTVGDMLREATSGGDFDGTTYDADWPARAATSMW